jgi:5-methylcytosine-specific restriction endonuclease McrA
MVGRKRGRGLVTFHEHDSRACTDYVMSGRRYDPKPVKRFRATAAGWVDLRARKLLGLCRVCEDAKAVSLHHVLPRSQGGDDVAENLVELCGDGTTGCHGLVEARDPWARSLLGQRLTVPERAYVITKQSVAWLEKNYGVREAA